MAQRLEAGSERADYSGAVYGSLLAGAVVVGSSSSDHPLPAFDLMLVLVTTGLVFWLAHVYTDFVGDRVRGDRRGWAEFRAVGRSQRPVLEAVLPPAAVAAAGWLLGWREGTTAWLCLLTAITAQAGWAMVATARIGSPILSVVLSGLANVFLGSIIIMVKGLLVH